MAFLIEILCTSEERIACVPPKRRALSEVRGVTTEKSTFFIVIAVRTPNRAQTEGVWKQSGGKHIWT
jgi:hypothetical protein